MSGVFTPIGMLDRPKLRIVGCRDQELGANCS